MKKALLGILSAGLLFTGCVSNYQSIENENNKKNNTPKQYNETYNIPKVTQECNTRGSDWEVKIFSDGSGLCVLSEKRFENYEKRYFAEYNKIIKTIPEKKTTYIQPINKKEPCKLLFSYSDNNQWFKESTYKVFWDGECKDGFADGLGRMIEKDTLMDKWGLAIYKDGVPTYYVENDVLKNNLFEGITGGKEEKRIGVLTNIAEKNGDIDVTIRALSHDQKNYITTNSKTSPFWNGSYKFSKVYPNFSYHYQDDQNNDEAELDFEFTLATGNAIRNGWAIVKPEFCNRKIII